MGKIPTAYYCTGKALIRPDHRAMYSVVLWDIPAVEFGETSVGGSGFDLVWIVCLGSVIRENERDYTQLRIFAQHPTEEAAQVAGQKIMTVLKRNGPNSTEMKRLRKELRSQSIPSLKPTLLCVEKYFMEYTIAMRNHRTEWPSSRLTQAILKAFPQ